MGTWGTSIFSNDNTCDVRDCYSEMLIMGATDNDAEQMTIETHAEMIALSPNDFWIALALTQWNLGRLSEHVMKNALKSIETELSTLEEAWASKDTQARCESLIRAQQQLHSPMPPRKKLRMPSWSIQCPWVVGNVLQYRINYHLASCEQWNEHYIFFHVAGRSPRKPYRVPLDVIEICMYKWVGSIAPSPQTIEQLRGKLELVPFRSRIGLPIESMCIMPTKKEIKRSDIKLVSETPLFSEASWPQFPATTPNNGIIEEYIGYALNEFAR